MKKIIQLTESEYKEIFNKSVLTDSLIEKQAHKLYQENGTYAIVLNMRIGDYEDKLKVVADGYVKDWDSKFPLKEDDKEKIIKFTKRRAEELFEGYYGRFIYDMNLLKQKQKDYENRRKLLNSFTITGWLLAIVLFISILLWLK